MSRDRTFPLAADYAQAKTVLSNLKNREAEHWQPVFDPEVFKAANPSLTIEDYVIPSLELLQHGRDLSILRMEFLSKSEQMRVPRRGLTLVVRPRN